MTNQASQLKLYAYKFLDELISRTGSVPDQFKITDLPLTVYSEETWIQLIKEGFVVAAFTHNGLVDATFSGDKVWNYSPSAL